MKWFIVMILTCGVVFAQDVVVSYDENSLPVLNEELRKIDMQVKKANSTVAASNSRLDAIEARLTEIEAELGI